VALARPRRLGRELVELAALFALAVGLLLAAWAVNSIQPPSATISGAAATNTGRQLFQSKGCIACHSAPGLTGAIPVGPALGSLVHDAATRRPPMPAVEYVRESIREPTAFKAPGNPHQESEMPKLPVSDGELEALVAFLLAPS
jgi:cytochrome c oxidase subunit 2